MDKNIALLHKRIAMQEKRIGSLKSKLGKSAGMVSYLAKSCENCSKTFGLRLPGKEQRKWQDIIFKDWHDWIKDARIAMYNKEKMEKVA